MSQTDEIAQAIAGSSVIANVTRIVGPSLGALAINQLGLASAFYLNGLSFLGVVLAWLWVRPTPSRIEHHESFVKQTREGLRYARSNPQVLQLLVLAVVMSAVVFQSALLPVIASTVLHSGAGGLACFSLPVVPGPSSVPWLLGRSSPTVDAERPLSAVRSWWAWGMRWLAMPRSLWLSAAGVAVFGFSFFLVSAIGQTVLLTAAPAQYRGRVMGLFSMVTVGGIPVAALVGGALGSWLGPTQAVGVAAVIVFAYTSWFLVTGAFRVVAIDEIIRNANASTASLVRSPLTATRPASVAEELS